MGKLGIANPLPVRPNTPLHGENIVATCGDSASGNSPVILDRKHNIPHLLDGSPCRHRAPILGAEKNDGIE